MSTMSEMPTYVGLAALETATAAFHEGFELLESSRGFEVPVILLEGEPGVGKTHFSRTLQDVYQEIYGECAYVFFQFNDGTDKEEVVSQVILPNVVKGLTNQPVNENEVVVFSKILEAVKLSQTQKVVLLLDELDKARPETDNFFLSLFEEGHTGDSTSYYLNGKKDLACNIDNLVIVVTTNGQRELNPALYRRCIPFKMEFPSQNELIAMVPKMLGTHMESLKMEQVKYGIHMMLKYRALKPKMTMVQNQLVRILRLVVFCQQYNRPLSRYRTLFMRLVSIHMEDLMLLETYKPMEYITAKLWSGRIEKKEKDAIMAAAKTKPKPKPVRRRNPMEQGVFMDF